MSTEKKAAIGILIFGIFLVICGIASLGNSNDYAEKFKKEGDVVQATIANVKCTETPYEVTVTDSHGEAKKDMLGFEKTKTKYRTTCTYDYTYTYNGQSYTKYGQMEGKLKDGATKSIGVNKNDPNTIMKIPVEDTKGGLGFLIAIGLLFIVGGGAAIAKS